MSASAAALRGFWNGPGGGGEGLKIGYPLILAQLSFTLQTFVDRVFLTWYSPEAMAGAVTGLFWTYTVIGLFIYTGEYLTTFVAQYYGAGRRERIGPAIWQGVYMALLAGALVATLSPLARPLFDAAGHAPQVRAAEVTYSMALLEGAFAPILMATLASFFAGRGSTFVVLLVNVAATLVNVVLDYLWIFGKGGFPSWGVAGAAWATIASQAFGAAVYVVLILRPASRRAYATLSGWRLDPALFGRLLRYGLPAGLQVSLEILAFSLFISIVGRIGTEELAATSTSFGLNAIVFFPMYGLGLGVSSIVGRYLGGGRSEPAERSTWSGFWISLGYMTSCGLAYVLA